MDTLLVPPKKKRGRRDQGLHEQLHVQMNQDLKDWVMAQPGDAAAFVRTLIERERMRRELAAQYDQERRTAGVTREQ